MSFKDRSFADRFTQLGDEAELVFEDSYPQGYVRFGLNRPPIGLGTVPAKIRFTPDYLTSKGLVEVQGFGRDQVSKWKREKITALCDWHRDFRVDLFLWDSHNRRYGWVRLNELTLKLHTHHIKQFPEGTEYFAVPAAELPVLGWINHGDPLGAKR